ncbi:AraC family transcriptional regulator [Mycoavidus sp. B2-EB]|uniref:AraC family transcriptional regulator n=1 Tax=Mycoavidus sp. B2-EB TaxID=2651972 RepID=UPI0016274412|nr:AraC family transcriptional regulator [Mycoavidus sp. B2-EB]
MAFINILDGYAARLTKAATKLNLHLNFDQYTLLEMIHKKVHTHMTYEAMSPANAPTPLQTIATAVAIAGKMGVPAHIALANSGVTLEDLQTPEKMRMVTHAHELTVFSNIFTACGDTSIGLRIGQALDIYAYGILGAAMLTAPTLGEALQCLLDFPLLQVSYFKQSLRIDGTMAITTASGYHYRPDLTVINTDMCLASWYMQISGVLGKPLDVKRLSLVYKERPTHEPFYFKVFGCNADFNSLENAMYFPAELLAAPLPRSNPIQYHMMRGYCEHIHREWAAQQIHDVTTQILLLLRSSLHRYGSLNAAAQALYMSPKTLSRRLRDVNSSFQNLLDHARHDLALECLAHSTLSVGEIAQELGYAETTCFRRAFLRWTGQSPVYYRELLRKEKSHKS